MGKVYNELNSDLREFITRQKMFFVGSSPLNPEGLINISPKGTDSFRVLDNSNVAYQDLTGSGIESVAHIKENGRFVIMFCSFDESPKIVRLHGKGQVIENNSAEWEPLSSHFADTRISRAIIRLSIERVSDSCGWGVPLYHYVGERDQFGRYEDQVDNAKLRSSQEKNNLRSIEGLKGLDQPSV